MSDLNSIIVARNAIGLSFLDFVQRVPIQVAARMSREHLVQYWRLGHHDSRHLSVQREVNQVMHFD